MRGRTSRGPFFKTEDLPTDIATVAALRLGDPV